MNSENTEKIKALARRITRACKVVADDNINKEYIVEDGKYYKITVKSDSGYEVICIGDTASNNTHGYMYLYSNNTSERNSFPCEDIIVNLLIKVFEKEMLETGEGKACYFDWPEYGGMNKQLNYFSKVVAKAAHIK